jgi:hypothetical protein
MKAAAGQAIPQGGLCDRRGDGVELVGVLGDLDGSDLKPVGCEGSLTAVLAWVPAELMWMLGAAMWRMSPAAMTDFPALLTRTNNTDVSGIFGVLPSGPSGFRGLVADGHVQLGQQLLDALVDLVADRAHSVEVLAGWVGQFPVLVAFSREDRAGIPAAHGDDDVGGLHDFVGPGLGVFASDVDTDLGHRRDGGRVDFVSGLGSARPGDRVVPALWVQRNSTVGLPSLILPSTRASACRRWRANRSASRGRKLGMLARPANWS